MFYYAEIGAGDRVVQQHNEDQPLDPLPEGMRELPGPINWTSPFPGAELAWPADAAAPVWGDPRSLKEARESAWARIKAARDLAEHAPFECDGNIYDADEKSTARISGATSGAMLSAMAGRTFAIDFTLADNTVVALNGAQMMSVGAALIARVGAVFEIARALRDDIDAVQPGPGANAALDAITWPE